MLLVGCTPPRPTHIENICSIFYQYPNWYWDAKKSAHRWGVPVSVQMAIIYQESRFTAKARPPREHLLWVIPWFRSSTSFGYTQSLKETWKNYQRNTGNGGSRDEFSAATQFIGWYGYTVHRRLGIPRNNAYELYLAYHEGIGGYAHRTYLRKRWLMDVAHHVAYRAAVYRRQLSYCASRIPDQHWWDHIL